jgi:hypothetical protein
LSFDEFAAHGIAGLRTRKTVAAYWRGWQSAVDAKKAKAVKPGDSIEEPKMPWPSANQGEPVSRDDKPVSLARRLMKDAADLTHAEIGPDDWPAVLDEANAVMQQMRDLTAAAKAKSKPNHPAGKAAQKAAVA